MTDHAKAGRGFLFKRVRLWDADGSFFPKRHRRAFVASHSALSDSDFLARCLAPEDTKNLVLVVRRAMGALCRVPPQHIHPDVTPDELIRMMFQWDDVEFLIEMEQLLGCEIPDDTALPTFTGRRRFRVGQDGAANFGEWAVRLAGNLRTIETVQQAGSTVFADSRGSSAKP